MPCHRSKLAPVHPHLLEERSRLATPSSVGVEDDLQAHPFDTISAFLRLQRASRPTRDIPIESYPQLQCSHVNMLGSGILSCCCTSTALTRERARFGGVSSMHLRTISRPCVEIGMHAHSRATLRCKLARCIVALSYLPMQARRRYACPPIAIVLLSTSSSMVASISFPLHGHTRALCIVQHLFAPSFSCGTHRVHHFAVAMQLGWEGR